MAKKTFNEGIAKNYRETCHACRKRVKANEASFDDNGNAYCLGCLPESDDADEFSIEDEMIFDRKAW